MMQTAPPDSRDAMPNPASRRQPLILIGGGTHWWARNAGKGIDVSFLRVVRCELFYGFVNFLMTRLLVVVAIAGAWGVFARAHRWVGVG